MSTATTRRARRGEYRAHPGAGAKVEDGRSGRDWPGVEGPNEKLAGAQQLRVEDPGQDQDGRPVHRFEDQTVVAPALQ